MKKLLVFYPLLMLLSGILYGQSFGEESLELPPIKCFTLDSQPPILPPPSASSSSCSIADTCSLITIGIVFHVVQDAAGTTNLQEGNIYHETFLDIVIERLNRDFRELQPIEPSYADLQAIYPSEVVQEYTTGDSILFSGGLIYYGDDNSITNGVDSPYIDDIAIEFKKMPVDYIQDSTGNHFIPDDCTEAEFENVFINLTATHPVGGDGNLHVYLVTNEPDALNPTLGSGIAVQQGEVSMIADFEALFYKFTNCDPDESGGNDFLRGAVQILRHELGHNLGLSHVFNKEAGAIDSDGCPDTPHFGPNSNNASNNIMAYNTYAKCITVDQRAKLYQRICDGDLDIIPNEVEPTLFVSSGDANELFFDDENYCKNAFLTVDGLDYLADYTWYHYVRPYNANNDILTGISDTLALINAGYTLEETHQTVTADTLFFWLDDSYFVVEIEDECGQEPTLLLFNGPHIHSRIVAEDAYHVMCEEESVTLNIQEIIGFPNGCDFNWYVNGIAGSEVSISPPYNTDDLSINLSGTELNEGLNIIDAIATSNTNALDPIDPANDCPVHCADTLQYLVYVNKPTFTAIFEADNNCVSSGTITVEPTYFYLTDEEIEDYFPTWSYSPAHFFSLNESQQGINPADNNGYNFQESQGHEVSIEVLGPSDTIVYENNIDSLIVYQLEIIGGAIVDVNINNPSYQIEDLSEIGDYIITLTVDGCVSNSDTLTIDDADPTPIASITPSDTIFCAGEIDTLFGSSSVELSNYTWTLDGDDISNDTLVPINTAGIYTLTVEAEGCVSDTVSFVVEYSGVDPLSCDDGCVNTVDSYNEDTCACENVLTEPNCDDGCINTADSYNAATCACENVLTEPNCDDGCINTADSYNATTCECEYDLTEPICDDNDCNTVDSYDEENCDCMFTEIEPLVCDDGDCNTTDSYDETTCECVFTTIEIEPNACDDNNENTEDSYDPLTCECVHELIIEAVIQNCSDVNLITLYPVDPSYTYTWIGIDPFTNSPITDTDNEVVVGFGDYSVTVTDVDGNTSNLSFVLPDDVNITSFTETNPTVITGTSLLWDDEFYNIKGTLTIQSGATLTLDNTTLNFEDDQGDDAGIMVESGGKLIVNNSTLTNGGYCNQQQTWEGILAKGNNTPHPNSSTNLISTDIDHAYVKLFNSRIENARIGVKCGYLTFGGPAVIVELGGIIHTYDTDFVNCGIGIDIYKFNHPSTINKIEYSSFISNNDNPFLLNPMLDNIYNAGLVIQANVRHPIHGNKFENNADPTDENNFIGAFVSDASTIFGKANNGTYGNEFNNLYKGIDYYSGPSVKSRISINENSFNNTEQAITLTGGLLPVISKNTINLPDLPAVTSGSKVYGIYTDGTQAFKIFDNDFSRSGSISDDVFAMYINASSGTEDYESTILRNRFNGDFERGISFEQQNQLIKLDCNEFLGQNQQDLFVSGYLADQGECAGDEPDKARRNLFGVNPVYHLDMTALTEDFPSYIMDYDNYNFKYAGHSDGNFTPDPDLTQSVLINMGTTTDDIIETEECNYDEIIDDSSYCIETYPKVKSAIDGVDISVQVDDIKEEIGQATDPRDVRTLNTKLLHTRVEGEQYEAAKTDLEEEGTDISIKVLVATNVKEENYEQAQTRLETLPLDKDENVAFYDLYSTIIDGVLAPSGTGKQPHEQEVYLRREAESTPTNQVNHYAQAVMAHHYLEVFPKTFKEDDKEEESGTMTNQVFDVFPNPATKSISLVPLNDLSLNGTKVVITDFMGNRLLTQVLNESVIISVDRLKAGIYLCELYQTDGTLIGTKKFVKF